MKKISTLLTILFLFNVATIALAEPLVVTYIANEGFLFESNGKKVLIDSLFSKGSYDRYLVPSQEILEKMYSSVLPFNDIDVVLVTHHHWDHFNAKVAAKFLSNNKKTILVGSRQVHEKLKSQKNYTAVSSQIKEINIDLFQKEDLLINGINISSIRLNHCPYFENGVNRHKDVLNIAYHINLNGNKIFHTGDATIGSNRDFFSEYDFK